MKSAGFLRKKKVINQSSKFGMQIAPKEECGGVPFRVGSSATTTEALNRLWLHLSVRRWMCEAGEAR